MKTILALLTLASVACADDPEARARAAYAASMIEPVSKVVISEPAPVLSQNIFADYPAAKLRAALQPPVPPQPVARAVRPNQGSCVCNRTGGDCLCQPASLCAQGRCPQLQLLRRDEVPYYFPNPTYCPPGRP